MCEMNSARLPVKMFTTPPGRSLVARISANVAAGSGNFPMDHNRRVAAQITGATSDTNASSDGSSGASTTTTPVGSGS